MASQSQIRANRRNARKCTGPRTPEGKVIACRNAITHALSARRDVIGSESQAEFDAHREALLRELAPGGPPEAILAERVVSLAWGGGEPGKCRTRPSTP